MAIHVLLKFFADMLYERGTSEGFVVVLSAPWGSGKTSCINLMKERLREHKNVELLDFAPWWFPAEANGLIT